MTTNLSCLKRCFILRQSCVLKLNDCINRGMFTTQKSLTKMENEDNIDNKIDDKWKKLEEEEERKVDNDEDLVEPTTCCMSGCANCVWIEYAEKLSKTLQNSNEDVQKVIMDKVQDPNMRAFLSMELRHRKLIE